MTQNLPDGGDFSPDASLSTADARRAAEAEAMGKGRNILVSWVSVQHAAAPLITVLENTDTRISGPIDRVVLCHRVNARETGVDEPLTRTLAQLEELPTAIRPEVALRPWRTTAPPTDHKKILEFSKQLLLDIRRDFPLATVYLHLSPGTKAMHAAWLILAHGAFIDGVHLLQTREDRFRDAADKQQGLVERVSLPRETWGHFVRASAPAFKAEDDDGVLWDPTRVISARGRATLTAVERWAPLPVPILLVGERGTGKTSLAHVIRARSGFAALGRKPWPVVVCGQFRANPELARSELFGHARGAFTGASADREGVLETVEKDTLFLDEVADLDRGTQRLLMAALEGRPFQRLGEGTNRVANFRLLAATNHPISQLFPAEASPHGGEHPLDADFFDRISTFVIEIPPLRERREDLPLLWRSSIMRAARRLDIVESRADALRSLATDKLVLGTLDSHPLPGNIRDLHRAAWRGVAAIMTNAARAETAREAIAGLAVQGREAVRSASRPGSITELPVDLDAWLDAQLRDIFQTALSQACGRKAEAARLLGLPRKTFDYRFRAIFPHRESEPE